MNATCLRLTAAAKNPEKLQAGFFSADETANIGIDLGTPAVEAVGSERKSKFTGNIPKVTVAVT